MRISLEAKQKWRQTAQSKLRRILRRSRCGTLLPTRDYFSLSLMRCSYGPFIFIHLSPAWPGATDSRHSFMNYCRWCSTIVIKLKWQFSFAAEFIKSSLTSPVPGSRRLLWAVPISNSLVSRWWYHYLLGNGLHLVSSPMLKVNECIIHKLYKNYYT